MQFCGLSSDRNGLLICLWKQVTQMTNFSCHPLSPTAPFFSVSGMRRGGKNILFKSAHPWQHWTLCSAAVLSTLLCGSLAVRWLFDEGAELKQSGETERERRKAGINLAEPDTASAKHRQPRQLEPPKKNPKNTRCINPAAGHTFHTRLPPLWHSL